MSEPGAGGPSVRHWTSWLAPAGSSGSPRRGAGLITGSVSPVNILHQRAGSQGRRADQEGNTVSVNRRATAQGALAVGALGVVFGDIGTSPLYTVQTVFNPADPHPVAVSTETVFGIVSLIFWSVTIIVTVTYVLLVMRADNNGDGAILALITLIRRRGVPGGKRTKVALAAGGIFGASLFFCDRVITPAISAP